MKQTDDAEVEELVRADPAAPCEQQQVGAQRLKLPQLAPPGPASVSPYRQPERRQGTLSEDWSSWHIATLNKVLILVARGFEETDVSTATRTLRRTGWPVAVVGLRAGAV